MYDDDLPAGCYAEILGFAFILLAQGEGVRPPERRFRAGA